MRGDMREDQKTLVIWRRLGKKHGEGQGFKKNPTKLLITTYPKKLNSVNSVQKTTGDGGS
jgi:hypothetical protein